MGALNRLKEEYRNLRAKRWNRRIADPKVSIFCNNCMAGMLYHDYALRFCSPTVNLQIPPGDYIRFLANLDYYLACDVVEDTEPDEAAFRKLGGAHINFPIGRLDDVTLFFQHYHSFEEAREKWNERKTRVPADRRLIRAILVDTHCTGVEIEAFDRLDFEQKLFVTDRKDCRLRCDMAVVQNISLWYNWKNLFSAARNYEVMDFTAWINGRAARGGL